MTEVNSKRYYQDKDNKDLYVRVWLDEKGRRHGEIWGKGEWVENPKLAWMVADEIYENHPMTAKEVKELENS